MIVSTHIIITIILITIVLVSIIAYQSGKKLFYYSDLFLDKLLSKVFPPKNIQENTIYDPLYDELYSHNNKVEDYADQDYVVNTYYDNPAYDPDNTVPVFKRDPQRVFHKKDIDEALYRSHYQCEHVDKNGVRCVSHLELQADHHYPHSRGGATRYDPTQGLNIFENNLVILCGKHNRMKTNRHPSREETMRIEEMRYQTHYYH